MEKLIELLNEYGNEICNHWGDYQADMDFTDRDTYWYLSKKFWFIKWLVKNEKIDRKKLEIRPFSDGLVYSDSDCTVYRSDTTYEMLLMLLSISDKPIEDLINYLK
jgi:hypothetical protein